MIFNRNWMAEWVAQCIPGAGGQACHPISSCLQQRFGEKKRIMEGCTNQSQYRRVIGYHSRIWKCTVPQRVHSIFECIWKRIRSQNIWIKAACIWESLRDWHHLQQELQNLRQRRWQTAWRIQQGSYMTFFTYELVGMVASSMGVIPYVLLN